MTIQFHGLPSDQVDDTRTTGRDIQGGALERQISSGKGTPCRHCLKQIPEGAPFVILAWRPFPETTAYAETGPIFLCETCEGAMPSPALPGMLTNATYCLRPYGHDAKIRYGHEQIVQTEDLCATAEAMLRDLQTAHVDVRNPHTGCYQCRILRA